MKRLLTPSAAYIRASKRLAKLHPQAAESLRRTLQLLAEDAFHPELKTHKLKGDLQGCWACSAGYDLRIVFEFARYEGAEALLLVSIGSHDEVY